MSTLFSCGKITPLLGCELFADSWRLDNVCGDGVRDEHVDSESGLRNAAQYDSNTFMVPQPKIPPSRETIFGV